jgi:hypothetical protein
MTFREILLIVITNDFAPIARTERLVDLVIHLVAKVPNVAVAVKEEASSAVAARELVDVAVWVTGPVSLSHRGMLDD